MRLGVVHSLWKPLPGEFKDYIPFTKPNGYQSLHTTVLTPEAGVVEIQIRTEDMHQEAQFGVASHMTYKQIGGQTKGMKQQAQKSAFERLSIPWIRDLVPALLNLPKKGAPAAPGAGAHTSKKAPKNQLSPTWLTELVDAYGVDDESSEFVEGLKRDFFSHRVFVFTPRGDVIDLPTNSTAIDFAYAIHSELGNHMAGAKVNDKLVSFDTTLRNGDIVEIQERPSAKPTSKWLDFARTSMARRHIRIALEAHDRNSSSNTSSAKEKRKWCTQKSALNQKTKSS